MHADTLYHRMLAQEAAVAEAQAAGLPEPQFSPILSSVSRSTTNAPAAVKNDANNAAATTSPPPPPPPAAALSKDELPPLMPETQRLLTAAAQAALRDRLKTMTAMEREVEENGAIMEAREVGETGKRVSDIMGQRKKRREEGKGSASDSISGWFGW